ncbi:receptor-like protein 7 [Magnolia sinica]|uniref:receptor-like protein 7 n=1 Tax=Magnolia sinica TaxID=86752 RepID=UPI0026594103|nr:receptor-like protein 7 [Magnolia sinica]
MDRLFLSLPNKAFPLPIFYIRRFLLLFSLLFSSSFVLSSVSNSKALSTQHQCIEDHFSALLHLKQGFNFSAEYTMTTLSSWNPDNRDCCSWEGITCNGATGHVTSLDLSKLRIYGRIDFVSLFRLQSLQKLNLAFNEFDPSPIPSGFEQLTSLTHLNLSSLQFYGQIPLEISHLTTLVSLDLSYNQYFNGSYYEYLKLESPNIGAFVQNLSSLRVLHLDWVRISLQGSEWGLALSSALPLLHKLSWRECGLSGPIHPSLSKLHLLSELYLSGNNLSSAIPNSIFSLPNLQTLDVGYNPLLTAGEIPPNNTIRQLYLSGTGFCSNLQDSYGNLTLLITLELRHCHKGGPFPSWLVKLDNLVYLDLSSNDFSGPLPSFLANLHNLVTLDLSFNDFSIPLPSSFGNLSNLVRLDLSSNNFSGPIPSSYGNKFQNLQWFIVNNNSLSGTIPSSLFSLPSLQRLYLQDNQFSGQLDQFQYTSSSDIWIIDLSNNSLSGTIPSSLFSLPSLQDMDLRDNQFSGQLDQFQYTSSSVLHSISLSNNLLSGTIPSSLFSLPSLQKLGLRGRIPASLGNIKALESLDLSHNSVSGEIPLQLTKLNFLAVLELSQNLLTGSIPQGQQFNTFTNKSFLGNSELCGTPLSKKCEHVEAHASPPLAQSESKYD